MIEGVEYRVPLNQKLNGRLELLNSRSGDLRMAISMEYT